MIPLLTLLVASALAQDAVGDDAHRGLHDANLDTKTTLYQGVGVLSGDGVQRGTGPISLTEARALNKLELGAVTLKVPLALSHRQSFGFALAEMKADTGVEAALDVGKSELHAGGELGYTLRPRWLDPYQPLPDGTLAATNRRSYGDGELSLGAALRPAKRHWVDLDYAYGLADYVTDPSFDPLTSPTHIPPGDHTAHRLELSWRTKKTPYRVEAGVHAERRAYTDQYARDAGTGATHAGAGGAPPNPLYVKWGAEPYAKLRWSPKDSPWTLRCGYGLEVQQDVYEGYYSYVGSHPEVGVDYESDSVALKWRSDANVRRYGANSYAVGGSHPPLLSGDRRREWRVANSVEALYKLGDLWAVVVEADVLVRRTNFPTYIPGVYPAGGQYDIDWNYVNTHVLAGVRYDR